MRSAPRMPISVSQGLQNDLVLHETVAAARDVRLLVNGREQSLLQFRELGLDTSGDVLIILRCPERPKGGETSCDDRHTGQPRNKLREVSPGPEIAGQRHQADPSHR